MEIMQIIFVVTALCFVCVSTASVNANIDITDTGDKINPKEWHIHVTMHVYSGRQDPTWLIAETHPAYNNILGNMDATQGRTLPSKLGYKGFSLVHIPPGGSAIAGGHQNWTVTSFPDKEMYLLYTTNSLHDDLIQHARDTILRPVPQRKRRSYYDNYNRYLGLIPTTTEDPLMKLSNADMYALAKFWGLDKRFKNITTTPPPIGPTKYEPKKWDVYFVQEHNNCYNYANNRITETFAQPGRAGNCEWPKSTITHGSIIEKLAKCDGLEPVPAPDMTRLPKHDWNLVALVFWPPRLGSDVYDFHWYRLDGNGHWSHKPGKTGATNVDQSEKTITDPRHADRGHYTEFVGFMQTRQDKVILI